MTRRVCAISCRRTMSQRSHTALRGPAHASAPRARAEELLGVENWKRHYVRHGGHCPARRDVELVLEAFHRRAEVPPPQGEHLEHPLEPLRPEELRPRLLSLQSRLLLGELEEPTPEGLADDDLEGAMRREEHAREERALSCRAVCTTTTKGGKARVNQFRLSHSIDT